MVDGIDRRHRFYFDKGVSIGNVISLLIILGTLFQGFAGIANQIRMYSAKTNIMWSHFIREHEDISPDELLFVTPVSVKEAKK